MPRRDLESLLALLSQAVDAPAPPPDLPPQPLLLTVEQVVQQLALSRASVQRLLTSGALRSVRIGSARRVRFADLQQFVEELTAANGGSGAARAFPSGRDE